MVNRATGNVLVPTINPTAQVRVLSGTDGADLGSLNMTGVTGGHNGTFNVMMGGVADDGVIYVGNLEVNAPVFQIWRWAAENTNDTPISVFGPADPGPEPTRIGDSFAVRGRGVNTQVIASGTGSAYFTIFTTSDGTNFVPHQMLLPGLSAGDAMRGVPFDGTNNAFYAIREYSRTVHHIGFDLATDTCWLIESISLPLPTSCISIGTQSGIKFMPGINDSGDAAALHRLQIFDITDPSAAYLVEGGDLPFPGEPKLDGNATGSTDIGAGMIVGFNTHNGLLALNYGVVTNPASIRVQPQDLAVYVSGTATFAVTAAGSPPLRYQWYYNGTTALAGATDRTLTLSDITAAKAGDYSVRVSNAGGSETSVRAKLTVATPTGYAAKILADGPANYWRLGETAGAFAGDSWGGCDGTYTAVNLGVPGYSLLDANTAAGFSPAAGSSATFSSFATGDLVGPSPYFTFETWAKFDDLTGVQRLFSTWQSGVGGMGFGINGPGGLRFTTFGVQDFDLDLVQSGFGTLKTGTWYHFAGVSEGGVFYFYINGQQVGVIGYTGEALASTRPLTIGRNPEGAPEVVNGQMDEVVFYWKGLTAEQVLAHYQARYGNNTKPLIRQQPAAVTNYASLGATLSVRAEGTEPLSYQWKRNGVAIADETADALVLTALASEDEGNYSVEITNPAGSTQSAVAYVTVLPIPQAVDLSPGLVLHMKFDGDHRDGSGRGNNGTKVGSPGFVAGKIGSQAVHVSTDADAGTYNYVTLGTPADLQFGSDVNFSVAFWVRMTIPNDLPGDLPFLCNATNSSYNFGYTFSPSYMGGGWTWTLYNSAKTGPGTDGADGSINDGNWHHLAFTFDRAGQGTTYLDGALVDARSAANAGNLDTGKPTNIGQDANGTYGETGQFDLDDMGVWRRVLTPMEVAAMYVAGNTYGASLSSERVKIQISMVNGKVQLTWTGTGVLQQSDEVSAGYADVPGATSPYSPTPMATKKFYRLKQ
jgi:hypothetical protein